MEALKQTSIAIEVDRFNTIIDELTVKEVDDFIMEVKIPKKIITFLKLDSKTMEFVSREHNVPIGNIYDIVDKEFANDDDDDELDEDES
jgi:hypothetical protein